MIVQLLDYLFSHWSLTQYSLIYTLDQHQPSDKSEGEMRWWGRYQVRQICKAFWDIKRHSDCVFEKGNKKVMTQSWMKDFRAMLWPSVWCNDSMAPGIMHILFVHSDGFVIKEFHFLLPSEEWERGSRREKWGFQGTCRDVIQATLDLYTFTRRAAQRETQMHTPTLIPACKPVPRPCMAPGPAWRQREQNKRRI